MKKIFSLFFLFLFLYNIIGYYFLFGILLKANKNEVGRSIANDKDQKCMETIVIKKGADKLSKDFEFIDKKEFRYKGNLYDIVKKDTKGDSIYFYCINDKKEKHLLANRNNHIKNHSEMEGPLPGKENKTVKIELVKDYFFNLFATNNYRKKESILYSQSDSFYTSFIKDITSPPPKEIVA